MRSVSSDQLDPYVDDLSGELRLESWREGDVLCITPPPSFRRAKPRPRHGQARVPEWVLHELERPTCPSQSQRANDIIARHEERRNVARQMLLRPSSIPSPPSTSLTIRSRIQDEFDYSSDFTEVDEEDAPWARSISRRVLTNETSSGDELLTSPEADDEDEDYEIKQLMNRRGRRFTKRIPTAPSTDLGKQSRGDGRRTAAKKPKASGSKVQDQVVDGRNVVPHDRFLDPWKLPPIANLTRKGPVNLIRTTATNSMTANDIPIISASEEMLLKSIKAKTRRLRKLERRHKKKRKTENK